VPETDALVAGLEQTPGEPFCAIEHVCHLRDIERDGYHVRIRRLLTEDNPSLWHLPVFLIAGRPPSTSGSGLPRCPRRGAPIGASSA